MKNLTFRLRVLLLTVLALTTHQATVSATVLERLSLEKLVETHQFAFVGDVTGVSSHWNDDGTMILTDAYVVATDLLKGELDDNVVITLMGGEQNGLTVLVVGAAAVEPGKSYVFFLNEASLPGAGAVLAVDAHAQGIFEIVDQKGELRAISQAIGMPLNPDSEGLFDAAGGEQGYPLETMENTIRELAKSGL